MGSHAAGLHAFRCEFVHGRQLAPYRVAVQCFVAQSVEADKKHAVFGCGTEVRSKDEQKSKEKAGQH
jgi:hypothetical protein